MRKEVIRISNQSDIKCLGRVVESKIVVVNRDSLCFDGIKFINCVIQFCNCKFNNCSFEFCKFTENYNIVFAFSELINCSFEDNAEGVYIGFYDCNIERLTLSNSLFKRLEFNSTDISLARIYTNEDCKYKQIYISGADLHDCRIFEQLFSLKQAPGITYNDLEDCLDSAYFKISNCSLTKDVINYVSGHTEILYVNCNVR